MADAGPSLNGSVPTEVPVRIQSLSVAGFKSINAELTLELQPLTILAGANSSGKSSRLQPLLLLKQTLEAPYDPGPLLLNGPNVEFTSVSQFLCRSRTAGEEGTFSFGINVGVAAEGKPIVLQRSKLYFRKTATEPLELKNQSYSLGRNFSERTGPDWEFKPGIMEIANSPYRDVIPLGSKIFGDGPLFVRSTRNRCFIDPVIIPEQTTRAASEIVMRPSLGFENAITRVIHVPGLRGNPRRNYPVTAVGDRFPGTFEKYVASVIATAQTKRDERFLDQLGTDLRELGLVWHIQAKSVDDAQVELLVGRLPQPSANPGGDLVSIADVGFGVSQTLPVVVALLTAKPGQLVYVEQPEIHLHPRAQVAMAGLLARAANRGVQVVVETHSSLLLLGIQRLVAEETIDPAKIKLHWFKRDETTGNTAVRSAEFDSAGTFGDWPEDFDDVALAAQQRYLDAAEKKFAR